MSTRAEEIAQEYERWVRVVTLVHYGGKQLCLDILHNRENFPADGAGLYNALLPYQPAILAKVKTPANRRGILNQDQYDLIFPATRITNASLFDITLFTFLLQELFGNIYKQVITNLRQWRNKEFHNGNTNFTQQEFNTRWQDVMIFFQQNGVDITELANLKHCALDQNSQYRNAHVEAELLGLEIKFDKEIAELKKNRHMDNQQHTIRIDELKKQFQIDLQEKFSERDVAMNQKINALSEECKMKLTADGVTDKVWETIAGDPNLFNLEDWRNLAERLGYRPWINFLPNSFTWRRDVESIKKFLLTKDVSWKILKNELNNMGKENVIKILCENTTLTKELDLFLKEYKRNMLNEMTVQVSRNSIPQKFNGSSKPPTSQTPKTKGEAYIDLAIVEGRYVDEKWCEDEKDFQQMKFNLYKESVRNIGIKELVADDDNVIILSGIAGIGKSTLCDQIKYQWASNTLLNGKDGMPKIDLLLSLTCRQLNTRHTDTMATFDDLFPNLPDHDVVNDIRKRVLVLIDGADELHSIETISECEKSPLVATIHNLLNLQQHNCFGRVVITSRPKIGYLLQQLYKDEFQFLPKKVEICGFSEESVKTYVRNEFEEKSKASEIISKIKESTILEAMSSIPIFLWVLCGLYHEDTTIKTPETMTELLLYSSLIFLQNIFKEKGYKSKDKSLKQLVQDEEIVKYFIALGEISFKTLTQKKVVFFKDDDDIANLPLEELEKVGFLVKYCSYEDGVSYQYRHLVFQEIFTAMHILRLDADVKKKYYSNENLQGCLPLLCGLEGILQKQTKLSKSKKDNLNILLTSIVETECNNVMNSVLDYLEDICIRRWYEHEDLFFSCYFESGMSSPSKKILNLFGEKGNHYIVINFLSFKQPTLNKHIGFWVDISKTSVHFGAVYLATYLLSTHFDELVCLSKNSRKLWIYVEKNQELGDYFNALLNEFRKSKCITRIIQMRFQTSEVINVSDTFTEIVSCIEELELTFFNNLHRNWIESVQRSFQENTKSKLRKLAIKVYNDVHLLNPTNLTTECVSTLCKTFQNLEELELFGDLSGHQMNVIYQHMDERNKLKYLKILCYSSSSYYPSLQKLKHVDKLTFEYIVELTNEIQQHFLSELKELVSENDDKRLKYIQMIHYGSSEDFYKLLDNIDRLQYERISENTTKITLL